MGRLSRIFRIPAAVLLALPVAGPLPDGLLPPAPLASSGGVWFLSFSDDFEGTELDASKWTNGFGWGETAGHVAGGCDPANNVVEDGVLIQRAEHRPVLDRPYAAACIHSRDKFSQLHGYFEARMHVPRGRGLHSAFWGKPNDESWPPELDVEEISGGVPDRVTMSVHWREGGGHRFANSKFSGPDFSAGFHVFGAEWSPSGTVWYVDGVERARISAGSEFMDDGGPFYLIVNLQVGLRGFGVPDASTAWPAHQYVDYVRVWTRSLDPVSDRRP